jgi:flagellar biosynthesis protein FlhF
MEIKRILAKDARSANEKAAALYGGDVLVISCNRVGTQTELIVAVDSVQQAPAPAIESATPNTPGPRVNTETSHPFTDIFELAQRAPTTASADEAPQATPAAPLSDHASAHTLSSKAEEAMERVRGQALVSLVREEIASLRREFQLSRLGSDLPGTTGTASPARLMHEALVECLAPATLRGNLIEGLLDCSDTGQALEAVHDRLIASLQVPAAPSLNSGIHALCGPSGAGKTLMANRILVAAANKLPIRHMALISYADHKPGAWSQMQILAAQTGVEVYRARDLQALALLLEELGQRQLIVIDTTGSDPLRQAMELTKLDPSIALHTVMPTSASSDQLRRLHLDNEIAWQSLMLSKADDQPNPWPLLGFLAAHPLPISAIASSERPQDSLVSHSLNELVRWAVDKLQNTLEQTADSGPQLTAMLPRAVTPIKVRATKQPARRAVKSHKPTAQTAASTTCLQ